MKILYISPENTVGTLGLWKRAHLKRGNQCVFVTLYKTKHNYEEDICLDLPLVKTASWYLTIRHYYYILFRGKKGDYAEKEGNPPTWKPNFFIEKWFFMFRDWLWSFKIEAAIKKWNFTDYDIFHLEWGLEFYRYCHFVKKLEKLNKPIICTYHGQDLRTRGVLSFIDRMSKLNLTSELDLLNKHPDINYIFLPFNTKVYNPSYKLNKIIRIVHSPTNRFYKGSEIIIPVCEKLAKRSDVEFVLIENMCHEESQYLKQTCDILIDQVKNRGGWGYGMNSIEAMSMGLCCVTELVPEYEKFISDHPFINVSAENLYEKLLMLIKNPNIILNHKKLSRNWVTRYHDIDQVSNKLYEYYNEKNII